MHAHKRGNHEPVLTAIILPVQAFRSIYFAEKICKTFENDEPEMFNHDIVYLLYLYYLLYQFTVTVTVIQLF